MTESKREREQMLAYCAKIHDDDGVDPREYFKVTRPSGQINRKAMQLCSQVADTLQLVLSGEFDDEVLHNLQVMSVEPAPDTSQLAVTVCADLAEQRASDAEIQERLTKVAGRLRTEVAAAITRKRAPRLLFRVVRPPEARQLFP
jgi:ribosome-binding factor A